MTQKPGYTSTMTNTLHAHVDTASADCDGPLYRSWVETFNDEEIAESHKEVNDFSDIHFMNRVFANQCGPYAVRQLRITVDDTGFEYHEVTDEGYRNGTVRWCHHDTCDPGERTHRDVYAEQMGY
jgi:hypothetical protein